MLEFFSSVYRDFPLSTLLSFRMVFLGILIEALPFMLIGVLISALIQNYISENTLKRMLPQNSLFGIVPASLLGILFPICECGVVPITGRLIKKGLPLPVATAFMLSAPIINPVVAFSTAAAFNDSWGIAGLRLGLAFAVTVIASIGIAIFFKSTSIAASSAGARLDEHACSSMHSSNKITSVLRDSCSEFFDMGKYLIIGAFLSALAQTLIPYSYMESLSQNAVASIGSMMIFAFGISVCSTSDAFIAASFAGSFSLGSLLAFMVLGPMIDLKNSIMFLHVFPIRFIVFLIITAVVLCGLGAYLTDLFLLEVL